MQRPEVLEACPLCNSKNLSLAIRTIDFMVSEKAFDISKCNNCHFHFTNPRPQEEQVSSYYHQEKYLSHSKKQFSIVEKIYQLAKRYTLNWKLKNIEKLKGNRTPLNILDVGCGTGDFIKHCRKQNHKVVGVEPADDIRKKLISADQLLVHKYLAELNQKEFDVITFWHVLEHVYNLDESIQQVKTLLKEDGLVFVALPNHQSYDAKKYGKYWAGWDVPRHLWHFSKEDVKTLCKKHELKLLKIIPMKLDAYYVSMLSERYMRGKQNPMSLIAALFYGCLSNIKAKKENNYSSLIYILQK